MAKVNKNVVWTIIGGIGAILLSLISFFIGRNKKDDKVVIGENTFDVKPNEDGTEVLPQTPELDNTLDEMRKDVEEAAKKQRKKKN